MYSDLTPICTYMTVLFDEYITMYTCYCLTCRLNSVCYILVARAFHCFACVTRRLYMFILKIWLNVLFLILLFYLSCQLELCFTLSSESKPCSQVTNLITSPSFNFFMYAVILDQILDRVHTVKRCLLYCIKDFQQKLN